MSLKTRLIVLTVGLFVIFVGALVFFSATVLQRRFEQVLADQQFASTQRLAAELDNKLAERIRELTRAAGGLPADLRAETIDPYLAHFGDLNSDFSAGMAVIGMDGKAIADYPVAPGRRGTYFGDRGYFRQVVAMHKPYIDKPIMGRALKRPVLTIGVPVFDAAGQLRAVLTGIIDLTAANFLGVISQKAMTGKGEFFILSLQDSLIIAATDARRVMTATAAPGVNRMVDRIVGGFEGSDIAVSSEGISKLYSAKRISAANWAVVSALPARVAFGPLRLMQNYLYLLAGAMTLLALLAIRWLARRMLAPLEEAGTAMRRMTAGEVPMAPLPERRADEIGRLIGNFNRLIEDRQRHESALEESEQTQRRLNRALRLLSDCNMALVHAQREQGLLDEICRLVVTTGGYRMAWVGYAEQDPEKTVRPVSQAGLDEGYLSGITISWADTESGRGPTGTAIRDGTVQLNQSFLSNAAMKPWRESAIEQGYRSSIALPLVSDRRVFGALTIYSLASDAFAEDEVKLLTELANDLAFGIEALRERAQRQVAEEKLVFLAHHDPLTGLPNRLLLRDRFDRAIAGAERERSGVAMLFLDLDNFKQVNDSLGHDVGDRLLVQAVQRLQACVRDTDTISRQGGDEFVILLTGVIDTSVISQVAQKVLDSVAAPFEIDTHTLSISFSIGISLYPDDGRDFDTLFKNADTALYHAKDSGRDAYHFFAARMNTDALARMQLQSDLRRAVKNQEFLLHYQPQVDIISGRIVGLEALVRWQFPGRELIPPGTFIPLAEDSGMIIPIGEWVINEACRQAMVWQDQGLPPLVVAVNLSAHQFRRGDLIGTVAGALERSGLPAALLELELTESILLQETDLVMKKLHSLKEMGVKLSIDDFGTGYSSLSYLKRLSVDKLKIDQSFVRDLVEDADDAAIIRAIIQLGHTMQLSVIAEGVETEAQLAFLKSNGCDEAQGYLFSRPVAAEEFFALAVSLSR